MLADTDRLFYQVTPLSSKGLLSQQTRDALRTLVRLNRGGKLNDPRFGSRMRGEGIFAEQMDQMFDVACRKAGIADNEVKLSTAAFRRRETAQLSLFD